MWEFSFRKIIQPNYGDTVSNLKTKRRVVVSKFKRYGRKIIVIVL